MSRRRRSPIRQGAIPDPDKIIIPDKAPMLFQAKALRLSQRLVEVLHQIDPPGPSRGAYQTKYNAKVFPDMILVKSPNGAGQPLPLEFLDNLNGYTDWRNFCQKLKTFLDAEAQAVMEVQVKSPDWHLLQPVKGAV